jgi:hypothetical protein
LPLDWARQNRSAIWSRAVEQYKTGVDWIHTDEPMRAAIAERNINHQEIDPWADDVAAYLEKQQRKGELPVRVPQLLSELYLPKERHNAAASKRVTGIAEQLGWIHRRKTVGTKKLAGLWPPDSETGHPGHPLDTPMGVRVNSSDPNGLGDLGHPGHLFSLKLGELVGGQEPVEEPAAAPAPTPDTFGQKRVSGVATAEIDCSGMDLSNTDGCPESLEGCPPAPARQKFSPEEVERLKKAASDYWDTEPCTRSGDGKRKDWSGTVERMRALRNQAASPACST